MECNEEIRQFLIESNENLDVLAQQLVELEKNPSDEELIASVFRTIHNIKGTSGFFGFNILGTITHLAESLLGQVRDKERPLTPALVSLILEAVDAIKQVLITIEATHEEGKDRFQHVRECMNVSLRACEGDRAGSPEKHEFHAIDSSMDAQTAVFVEPVLVSVCRSDPKSAVRVTPQELARGEQASNSARAADRGVDGESRRSEHLAIVECSSIDKATSAANPRPDAMSPSASPAWNGNDRRARGSRREDDAAHSTIHVDITLLDKLANLVGELALVRNQILLEAAQSATSSNSAQRLNLITHALQESVIRARMQPIGTVWNMLPRVVRDLATQMGKKIEIQMEGATVELDKTILEAIKDPLTHLVRNACDHGIECPEVRLAKGKNPQGTIYLRASHAGPQANIEISDDGAGIDPEKIKHKAVEMGLIRLEDAARMSDREALRLILLPGLSTTETLTSISGRGVGMDVVGTNIQRIGGKVEVSNHIGGGLTLTIKIPLPLAILPGLMGPQQSRFATEIKETQEHGFGIAQTPIPDLVEPESEMAGMQMKQSRTMGV